MQTGLAELGYDPGPVDGKLGDQTRKAVRAFQKDRSLPVTGVVDLAVLRELRKVTGQTSLNNG